MKLSQIEKRIPQTLKNSKDIIQTDREYARRGSRARSTRGQENEAWALYKKFHPGSPEVTFLGTNTSFAQSHPTLLKNTWFLLFFSRQYLNTVLVLPLSNHTSIFKADPNETEPEV